MRREEGRRLALRAAMQPSLQAEPIACTAEAARRLLEARRALAAAVSRSITSFAPLARARFVFRL